MKRLKRLFGKRNYVFVVIQDKVLNDDGEKDLKNQIFAYVNKSTRKWFFRNKVKHIDYYNSPENLNMYTYMCTFKPENTLEFKPFAFELYAFCKTEDVRIFSCYEVEEKEFKNEFQNLRVLRIKI